MKFKAVFDNGIILTDEYDDDEIKRGLHVKHILNELKVFYKPMRVKIYDEHDLLIKNIKIE